MTHTKGPWIVLGQVLGETAEETEANGKLMEAAPDLLEACKAALALIGQSSKIDWDDQVTPLLEAAITKAT